MTNHAGRLIAVTGGAQGIGAAIAELAIRDGMRVVIGDIDVERARTTAQRLGSQARAYRLDVSDIDSFAAFLDDAERDLGPIDVLVNNAGIMPAGAFLDESVAGTRRQIDINILGVTNGCRLALPRFLARGSGHVINVASAAGKSGFPGVATYSGTKFFVVGFSDALRGELLGTLVQISVVVPGFVATELTAGFEDARFYKKIAAEDVARGVIDAIHRPRFDVFVPRALGPMTKLSGLLPPKARDTLARLAKADRIALDHDAGARAAYERRAAGN